MSIFSDMSKLYDTKENLEVEKGLKIELSLSVDFLFLSYLK
ncbi:hypothetical protein [Aliarcobacter cryaerophilus]|nr:hypothetical protein [Aliarcobacter cryaerophilus]